MKYILSFLLFTSILFANGTITISQNETIYTIGKDVSYLADTTNTLNIENIQEEKFTKYTKEIPNFGFLKPAYWFKFKVNYTPKMQDKKWWLKIAYPVLDYVDVYVYDSNNKQIFHKQDGDLRHHSVKDLKQNSIVFTIPSDSSQTYTFYMKVQTSGSLLIPIQILDNQSLVKTSNVNQILSGMYYGILIILILYNFITYLYTREKIYILYVAFVVSYAFWQLSFDGIGSLYFWGDIYWIQDKSLIFFIFASILTLIIFSQELLNSKQNISKYDTYIINPLKYLAITGVSLSLFLPYKYMIIFAAILGLSVPSTLFIAGLVVIKKDYYSVRLFVLGWGIFLIGTILFTLSKFSIIHGFVIMKYVQQIASATDMVLLSAALSERFKKLQLEYTDKLKSHNHNLQKQVESALEKEREKTKMLIEQSHQASMGEMIEQIAHQWRQPLNTLGLLNQDLYFKKQFNNLDDETFERIHEQVDTNIQYMSNTIDDFRNYYKSDKEEESYNLDAAINSVLKIVGSMLGHCKIELTINLQKNITVRNVKNELLQVIINILNNAKDALKSNSLDNKKINIKLNSDNRYAYIMIQDNAGGINEKIINKIFDPYFTTKFSSQGTGIGLHMAKTIVEKNLHGRLSVKNQDNGANFTIKLPLS